MPTTWEPGSVASVTLSGSNLVATNTGTTATNQGAHGLTTDGQTAGKYYFEATWTTQVGAAGTSANWGVGIGTPASTYTGMGNTGGVTGVEVYFQGSVWSNGANLFIGGGQWNVGQVMGIAMDLDNRKFWSRLSPSGIWNNNATYDPATNVGGITIPAGTMIPFVTFGGSGGTAGNVVTANFGASAFSGAAPSGFIAGFPTASGGAAAAQARAMMLA